MISVNFETFLAMLGFGVLAAAVAPAVSHKLGLRLPLSVPIACLVGGIVVGRLTDVARIDVVAHGRAIQSVTAVAVILSLTGCGLKLDRPLGLRSWRTAWRLLAITMPLSILVLAVSSHWIVGLPVAAALLFAAAMAPTDPVLAASVQVGPPGEGDEEEARFALTAEAGLNDGLAFPFVHLALAAAVAFAAEFNGSGDPGLFDGAVLGHWLLTAILWKTACGVAVGAAVGAALGWTVFRFAPPRGVADAFLAVGLTLFVYGVTEVLLGYGFIAVFIAALTFRRTERSARFHGELHHFVEQTESLLLIGVIFATGIAVGQGLLRPLGWAEVAMAVLFLAVIRPLTAWLALGGLGLKADERFAVSVLGIRGVGSFYYLAYGLTHAPFSNEVGRLIWGMAGLIVTMSVLLHGLTAPKMMDRLQSASRGVGRRIGRMRRGADAG